MTDWARVFHTASRAIERLVTDCTLHPAVDPPTTARCLARALDAAADEIDRQAREPAIEPASVPLAQYQAAVAREDAACAERDAVQAELDMLRSREEASSAPTDRAVDAQSVDDLAREIREAATDEPRMEWRHLAWRERGFWHRIAANVLQREARKPAAYAVEVVGEHEIVFRGESWVQRAERDDLRAALAAATAAADKANTELAALRSSERERLISEIVREAADLVSPSWRSRVSIVAEVLAAHERARTAKEGAK